jgi:alkyldihydroxyacetonephosphate synthase
VITELTLRVRPAPERRRYEAWTVADFATGREALRALAQRHAEPTVLRCSDESETFVTAAQAGTQIPGCLIIAGYEASAADDDDREARAGKLLRAAGARRLEDALGAGWEHGRFAAPYLRDALLDIGAFAETLETATGWSDLGALHAAVRDALGAALPGALVTCHISHVYAAGASLYFTVIAAAGEDPIEQWRVAKRAASEAIVARGATISHHHAVGVAHRDFMEAEVGELGLEMLRALKRAVDPEGILNPGKLIPPRRT